MRAKLGASRCAKKYADDVYHVIRDLGSHYDHALSMATWFKLIDMRRSHYTTVAQYVSSFQRAYIDANELNCGISPYTALIAILGGLKSDLPYWVAAMWTLSPEDAVTDYTDADLFKACRMAIEQDAMFNQRNCKVARGG
ncbi:hypothetical protein AtubIFM54640_009471 [Aspergillus tubingensis]|nr:hypothetical protein AtubIFM54640_009471 [Aspergillus tubingensis]